MAQKLLIVDDHQMFAEGIRFLIEHITDYDVVGALHRGQEVIPFMEGTTVDVLLLDIQLPDATGFGLAKEIRQRYPHTRMLALSMLSDKLSIDRMLDAGANGYCNKSAGWNELWKAIRIIGQGGAYLPTAYVLDCQQNQHPVESQLLTPRETEVMRLIVEGVSTKQMADRLFLSTRTVETHRKNIYRKVRVHTNVELTLYARRNFLI